ncbi:MAG: hypothetical protein ACRD4T_00145 [Candidatus Acidiferrales bacterium]
MRRLWPLYLAAGLGLGLAPIVVLGFAEPTGGTGGSVNRSRGFEASGTSNTCPDGYSFTADPDTCLRRDGAGFVALDIDGLEALEIERTASSTIVDLGGFVGISQDGTNSHFRMYNGSHLSTSWDIYERFYPDNQNDAELGLSNVAWGHSHALSSTAMPGANIGWWSVGFNTAAVTYTSVGIPAPAALTGTETAQPALGAKMYIQHASGATTGNVAGIDSGPFSMTRPAQQPKAICAIRTDSAITLRRVWCGLAESSLAAVAVAAAGASAVDFMAIGFDTAVDAEFQCCSGDGTNYSCTEIPFATVAVSKEYMLTADFSTAGNIKCCVRATGDVGTTCLGSYKTTNIPGAVSLGLYNALTTLEDAAKNHQISLTAIASGHGGQ